MIGFEVGKKYINVDNKASLVTCVYSGSDVVVMKNNDVEFDISYPSKWKEYVEPTHVYLNVYKRNGELICGGDHRTRELADKFGDRVGCVKVLLEERFDD